MRDRNLLALLMFSLLIAPVLVIQARLRSEVSPERHALSLCPKQIGKWTGVDVSLDHGSVEELRRGDYLSREYHKASDAQPPISLYIDYEPVNSEAMIHVEEDTCLPGLGWVVTDRRRTSLSHGDGSEFTANQSIVSRADDRILVEYWYQIHGRTLASQNWARYYLKYDRVRLRRSDGAMLMLQTHLKRGESVDAAQERLRDFESKLTPLLDPYIPR